MDSRARGNAPQMLDKYKKLAHDAHLNGDRVQEEYYLQFADHYFRVLADQKQRMEDARQRRDDRAPEHGDSSRSEEPRYRDEDDYLEDGDDTAGSIGGERERSSERDRPAERERPVERERPAERERSSEREEDRARSDEGSVYEPAQNPFVRDNAAVRGAVKPRKPRRPREPAADAGAGESGELNLGVDPSVLPPSIGAEKVADEPEAEVKPRRRTRKPKAAEDKPSEDPGEKLETVS